MTRIYVPASVADLHALSRGRLLPRGAFGVTPALVSLLGDDREELEFAALELASDASRAGDRRIVVAADVADDAVSFDAEGGGMDVHVAVTIDEVAAIHIGLDAGVDLAWYATQELDEVLSRLEAARPTND